MQSRIDRMDKTADGGHVLSLEVLAHNPQLGCQKTVAGMLTQPIVRAESSR
jgi:hypothetical protein